MPAALSVPLSALDRQEFGGGRRLVGSCYVTSIEKGEAVNKRLGLSGLVDGMQQDTRVLVTALPLTCCVTLSKSLPLAMSVSLPPCFVYLDCKLVRARVACTAPSTRRA